MKARSYTTKIEIKIRGEVSDGYGGTVPTESLVKKVWADVSSKGAGYKFQQFGLNDFKNPVIFSIRGKNNLTLTEKHFVVYKGMKFEIKGIEDQNFEGLEYNLFCDEA